MRVCLVASPFSIHTRRWIDDYADMGHEVHVITHYFDVSENPKVTENVANAEVHELASPTWIRRLTGPFQTKSLIKDMNPDVVHAHYVASYGFYGAFSGFHPFVVSAWGSDIATSKDSGITAWPDRYGGVLKPFIKYTLNQADVVHTVAGHLSDGCAELGASQNKIMMFPRTPDPERFNLDVGPAIEEDNVVISVRPFRPLYSLETLLKAVPRVVEQVPDSKFIFMGNKTGTEELKGLAKSHGAYENSVFKGSVPYSEMPRWLAASDVYVSTSPTDAGHVSLLESMMCGSFPVVTDIRANSYWVDDGENGFLFPSYDSESLAEKIVKTLNDDDLRESIREENWKKAQKFPRKEYMEKLIKMIQEY